MSACLWLGDGAAGGFPEGNKCRTIPSRSPEAAIVLLLCTQVGWAFGGSQTLPFGGFHVLLSRSTCMHNSLVPANMRVGRITLYVLLALALWLGAVYSRRQVFYMQTIHAGSEAPFQLEAALQFRMTKMVAEDGGLPVHDPEVQYPEGVKLNETYSLGAETWYATLAGWLPDSWTLATRVRWASVLLFSLAIPLFAAWIGLWWRSGWAMFGAGLVLIWSPAFVLRSSGLGLSRENLAFPFMAAFLLTELCAHRAEERRGQIAWAVVAAVSIVLAQVYWDFSQYLIGLWLLKEWAATLRGFRPVGHGARMLVLAVAVALTIAAFLNPYLRSHGYGFSPMIAALWALVIAQLGVGEKIVTIFGASAEKNPGLVRNVGALLVLASLVGVSMGVGKLFAGNYSHFGELLVAKLVHLNQKPLDPGRLTYIQRIMWTPALNSSTWGLTKHFFPLFLWMGLGVAVYQVVKMVTSPRFTFPHVLAYFWITLGAYVLFFRMHVYLVVFVAWMIGYLWAWFGQQRGLLQAVTGVLLVGTLAWEAYRLSVIPSVYQNMSKEKLAQIPQYLSLLQQQANLTREQTGLAKLEADRALNMPSATWGTRALLQADFRLDMSRTEGFRGFSVVVEDVNIKAQRDLVQWLRENSDQQPVLAPFTISGPILAYAGNPILLHPKFETPGIRERVRQFAEHLFLKSELELRNWAVELGAVYLVVPREEFGDSDPTLRLRYMVDAMVPPDHAAARVFEFRSDDTEWSRKVHENEKYMVFKFISDKEIAAAKGYLQLALMDLEIENYDRARSYAVKALEAFPKYTPAKRVIVLIEQKRAKGEIE